ncbi:MAG: sel1 repeat family protein [Rhodomicrobium sp.]|nr:sel1 repeat family protein [Rhodomicrobium sp.]
MPEDAVLGDYAQPEIFTSRPEGRRGLSGGKAVMLICAVAIGATAATAQLLHRPRDADGLNATGAAQPNHLTDMISAAHAVLADVAAQLSPGGRETEPVAAFLPLKDAGVETPIVIRIAQGGASGLVVEDVTGEPSLPLPMKVRVSQQDAEEYAFIMLRGLPDEFTLSAGFRLKDAWAVSLRDLGDLILLPPANYRGQFDLEVLLVKGRDKPVESRAMTVTIGKPASPPAATASGGKPDQRLVTSASPEPDFPGLAGAAGQAQQGGKISGVTRTISAKEESEMLDRAMKILGDGDIASARLLLEHIARQGSGKGALTLAQTYDPLFFRSISALGGVRPDPEKAKVWYALAAELGQEGARERLGALSAN